MVTLQDLTHRKKLWTTIIESCIYWWEMNIQKRWFNYCVYTEVAVQDILSFFTALFLPASSTKFDHIFTRFTITTVCLLAHFTHSTPFPAGCSCFFTINLILEENVKYVPHKGSSCGLNKMKQGCYQMYPRCNIKYAPCHQAVTFQFSIWFQQWSHRLTERWHTKNSATKKITNRSLNSINWKYPNTQ